MKRLLAPGEPIRDWDGKPLAGDTTRADVIERLMRKHTHPNMAEALSALHGARTIWKNRTQPHVDIENQEYEDLKKIVNESLGFQPTMLHSVTADAVMAVYEWLETATQPKEGS
jgi:hypothetical protein